MFFPSASASTECFAHPSTCRIAPVYRGMQSTEMWWVGVVMNSPSEGVHVLPLWCGAHFFEMGRKRLGKTESTAAPVVLVAVWSFTGTKTMPKIWSRRLEQKGETHSNTKHWGFCLHPLVLCRRVTALRQRRYGAAADRAHAPAEVVPSWPLQASPGFSWPLQAFWVFPGFSWLSGVLSQI